MADFKVQRGTVVFTAATDTVKTIVAADEDYTAPSSASSAFCHIVSSHRQGKAGATAGGGAKELVKVTYATDITVSITFTRGAASESGGDVTAYWEIVEYTGSASAANEFIVRGVGLISMSTAETAVNSGTISDIATDADVVVFPTGAFTAGAGGGGAYIATLAWDSGNDQVTATRGATGTLALEFSYAVVEFTGTNWTVEEFADYTLETGQTVLTAATVSDVGDLAKAFVVPTWRSAQTSTSAGRYYTFQVYLSATTTVSCRTGCGTGDLSSHIVHGFVVSNSQADGTPLAVQHENQTFGATDTTTADTITAVSTAVTSLVGLGTYFTSGNLGSSFVCMGSADLTTTTNVNILRAANSETSDNVRYQVVEWPTVAAGAATTFYTTTELTIYSGGKTPLVILPTGKTPLTIR